MDITNQKKISQSFEQMFKAGQKPWRYHDAEQSLQILYEKIRKEFKNAKVLDLGCGDGWITFTCASHGFETWGIDSSKTAIKECLESSTKIKFKAKVHFVLNDVLTMKYEYNFFDVVIDRGLFHHILPKNRGKYIANILKVTKKKSILYLSVFSQRNEGNGFEPFDEDKILKYFGKNYTVDFSQLDPFPTTAPAHLVHFILKRK